MMSRDRLGLPCRNLKQVRHYSMTALSDLIVLLSSIPALLLTWFFTRNTTNFFKQPRVSYDSIEEPA